MSVYMIYLIFVEIQCVDTTLFSMVNEEILFPEPWATSIIHSALNFEVRHGNSILQSLCKLEIFIIYSHLIRPCAMSYPPCKWCIRWLLSLLLVEFMIWFQSCLEFFGIFKFIYMCKYQRPIYVLKIHMLIECIKCQVIFSGFFNASCILLIYM